MFDILLHKKKNRKFAELVHFIQYNLIIVKAIKNDISNFDKYDREVSSKSLKNEKRLRIKTN